LSGPIVEETRVRRRMKDFVIGGKQKNTALMPSVK